jgi:hypothetical protein
MTHSSDFPNAPSVALARRQCHNRAASCCDNERLRSGAANNPTAATAHVYYLGYPYGIKLGPTNIRAHSCGRSRRSTSYASVLWTTHDCLRRRGEFRPSQVDLTWRFLATRSMLPYFVVVATDAGVHAWRAGRVLGDASRRRRRRRF